MAILHKNGTLLNKSKASGFYNNNDENVPKESESKAALMCSIGSIHFCIRLKLITFTSITINTTKNLGMRKIS